MKPNLFLVKCDSPKFRHFFTDELVALRFYKHCVEETLPVEYRNLYIRSQNAKSDFEFFEELIINEVDSEAF